MTTTTTISVSTHEAAELLGATYRQVDWLIRNGDLNHRSFDKRVRRFDAHDLKIMWVLISLHRLGARALAEMDIAQQLHSNPPRDGDLLLVTLDGEVHRNLPAFTSSAWLVEARDFAGELLDLAA